MDTLIIDKAYSGPTESKLEKSLNALKKNIIEKYSSLNGLIKLNIFLNSRNDAEFFDLREEAVSLIEDIFEGNIPAYTIISEPPLSGNDVLLEGKVMNAGPSVKIERHTFNKHNYVVVSYDEGKRREMYTGGIASSPSDDFIFGCQKVFDFAEQLLMKEDMTFGNVVRQWNYVPQILDMNKMEGRLLQNYQIFNDIRAFFYNPELFRNGYPAATGIGSGNGSVTIDIIAVMVDDEKTVIPLKNPGQQNAYSYSEKVLAGEPLSTETGKKPPLFERGKLVRYKDEEQIYVSGTASIKGEQTVAIDNVKEQTEVTIDNIMELTSSENLERSGLKINAAPVFDYVRVYVKNKNDYSIVKSVVEEKMNTKNIVFVEADICRDNLLVEIEADIII